MIPPGLLGAALVFWGWQTGVLALGVVMAALVESRHLVLGVRLLGIDAPTIGRYSPEVEATGLSIQRL